MHETHFPDSTVIQSAAYDDETDELTIRLRTGRTYIYRDVAEWVYDELRAAESAGRYYNLRIRDAFPYSEVIPLRRRSAPPRLPPARSSLPRPSLSVRRGHPRRPLGHRGRRG
jgi:hypothetical protein